MVTKASPAAPAAAEKLEHWLAPDIVVKCVNRKVGGGAYYKKKGVVQRVVDRFSAVLEMAEGGDVLQLDQDDLETVIPAVGKRVAVLNGMCRGSTGVLRGIDVDDFSVSVEIDRGPDRGAILERVDYEDVSRLA